MNASSLGRIFWKEYRTQRSLWIAIVGLFSLLTMLIPVIFGENFRPEVYSLFYAGLLASGIYAVASTSILYASEVEQGTKSWLGVLPMKPAGLMLPKLAWVISSTLTAMVAFWCVAHLVGRTDLSNHNTDGIWQGMLVIFCLMFCCAIICSQWCSHVLKAIGLAAVFIIGTVILAGYIHDQVKAPGQFNISLWYGILSIFCFLYLGFAVVLNRRWLRESSFAWRWSISVGRQLTLDRALALPLETSPFERSWRRQLWLEWRNAWVWMLGIVLMSVILLAILSPLIASPLQNVVGYFFSIIACLVPLLCGVASCRGEQLHQRFLFQGNRGVSSGQLLWAKHLVWMSFGAMLIFGLVWWGISQIPYATPTDVRQGHGLYSFWLVPLFTHNMSNELRSSLESSLLPGIQLIATIALLSYTIGHFCSLLFSQPILGLCVAGFGTSIGVAFVMWGYVLGIPLYVMTLVPATSLFLLSLYRGKDWIIARSDRKVWLRFDGWMLLGLWTWISLLAGWRVSEVHWSALKESSGLFQERYIYPMACAGLLILCVLGVSFADFLRRNYQPRSGKSTHFKRRWLTPLCLLCVFLIGHNSLIALGLMGNSLQLDESSSKLIGIAREMSTVTMNRPGPDLYLVARDRIKRELPSNSSAGRIAVPQAGLTTTHDGRQIDRSEYIWNNWEDVNPAQREWLAEYEGAVEQFEAADRAGIFDRFSILDDSPGRLLAFQGESFLTTDERLLNLIRLKALEREHAGELAEAWDYHLKMIRFVKRALAYALPLERAKIQNWLRVVVFEQDLSRWQIRREQTDELLKTASSELKQELVSWPQLYKSYWRAGGIASALIRTPPESFRQSDLVLYVPGWERDRALGVIKEIISVNVSLAQAIEQKQYDSERMLREIPDRLPLNPAISLGHQRLFLKRFGESAREGYLLVANGGDLRAQALQLGDHAYEGPWHLTETTFILSDYPLGLDFLNAIHDRPEPILIDELDFRIAVQNWLTNCETETPLSAPKPTQETP